jgi:hypothetical protein
MSLSVEEYLVKTCADILSDGPSDVLSKSDDDDDDDDDMIVLTMKVIVF